MNHARKAAYGRLKDEKKTFRSVGSALLHRPRADLRARDTSKGAALFVAKTLRSPDSQTTTSARQVGTSATPLGLGSKTWHCYLPVTSAFFLQALPLNRP